MSSAAVLKVDLPQLRGHLDSNSRNVRGLRESLYQVVKAKHAQTGEDNPWLEMMEGAFFSALKSQYVVTLKLVFDIGWDSHQVSIWWGKIELGRVSVAH